MGSMRQQAIFLVIDDRLKLNQLLEKVETKYLSKLIEIMKDNHFLKGLSKNALTKFLIQQPGNGKLKGYGNFLLGK